MNKGLEALEELIKQSETHTWLEQQFVKIWVNPIERELKALEIIKEKIVDTRLLIHSKNFVEYAEKTRQYADCRPLSEGEFIFLKEVIK